VFCIHPWGISSVGDFFAAPPRRVIRGKIFLFFSPRASRVEREVSLICFISRDDPGFVSPTRQRRKRVFPRWRVGLTNFGCSV
jgi:hypothetical protein